MAEAVKDLPDPLEEPHTEAGSSPDDLLSQMADQAISQLIDDSEKGILPPPAPPIEPDPIPEPVSEVVTEPIPVPADESSPLLETPAPPTETELAAEDVQSQLDNVLTELKSDPPPPAPIPEPAFEPEPAALHHREEVPDSRADIKALFEPAAVPVRIRHKPPAVIVKPLEWINLPFSSLPDTIRDTLGQIGIVTIINALAVLLYVILFKK